MVRKSASLTGDVARNSRGVPIAQRIARPGLPGHAALWLALLLAANTLRAAELPTVPNGFVIERVAGTPLVQRPIFAAFDPEGRLYVGESNGENLTRDELLARKPHWISRLIDRDGDGTFDESTRFVEDITLPQGALYHQGSLYAVCPPSLWKFSDTDGDGRADQREEVLTYFGFNGNACDTHGPFLSPTGRFVIVQGRHGHEFRDAAGKVYSAGRAARIYSCNVDGSDVRIHAGGGFDNPVEVDFTESGECIGTVNLLYRDRGDCLMHWVEGGVYPRDDQADMVAEFPWTGGLLGPVHNLGHVAVSGVVRNRSDSLGTHLRDHWFFTEFNTHKVRMARLQPSGSTYTASVEEFLTSSESHFHPTDVLQDADGSLLVLDTGAWFLNGCPTSQVSRPDLHGAVYRIRAKDAGAAPATARHPLAEVFPPLPENLPTAIGAIEALADDSLLSRALTQLTDRTWSEPLPLALSTRLLSKVSGAGLPSLRQFCELAATRCTDRMTPALTFDRDALAKLSLLAARNDLDRTAEHTLIVALQRQTDVLALLSLLEQSEPAAQRVLLMALADHAAGPLRREHVVPLLAASDPRLQQTALEVISRQRGWGAELLGLVREWLAQPELTPAQANAVHAFLLAQGHDDDVQQCLREVLLSSNTTVPVQELIWKVLRQAGLTRWPATLREPLAGGLESPHVAIRLLALQCAATANVEGFDSQLSHLANNAAEPLDVRCEATMALAPRLGVVPESLWTWLTSRLAEPTLSVGEQSLAARAVGTLHPSEEQLLELAHQLASASPLTLPSLVQPFTRCDQTDVGLALVEGLLQSEALASVGADQLTAVLRRYPAPVQGAAEPLFQRLGVDAAAQAARLQELLLAIEGDADPARGRDVFYGRKAACAACHHIRGVGGRVGPELTTIGASRSPRDLLEAIVYPSASFVNGYRTLVVATTDGQVIQGVMAREEVDSITLKTTDLREHLIRRVDIDEQREGTISIMPAGLDRQLSPEEFRDLLAFLRSLK